MQPRTQGLIWDLVDSLELTRMFIAGKSWEDYRADALVRSGVERQLAIAGESMSLLRKTDEKTASLIPHVNELVAMRNVLVHAYRSVNDQTVWQVASTGIDEVLDAARVLLDETR